MQAKDPLSRGAEVALDVVGDLDARGEALGEARAQALGIVVISIDALRVDPQSLPDLVDPVAGLTVQQLRQLFFGDS